MSFSLTEIVNILGIFSAIVTVAGFAVSFYFFYKTRMTERDLDIEKKRIADLRSNLHWQLQALHHTCNRLENLANDPQRHPDAIKDVSRSMKDTIDALMGQTLGKIHLFPWNNYPIISPETGKEIGRMIGNRQWFKDDWTAECPHRFGSSFVGEGGRESPFHDQSNATPTEKRDQERME